MLRLRHVTRFWICLCFKSGIQIHYGHIYLHLFPQVHSKPSQIAKIERFEQKVIGYAFDQNMWLYNNAGIDFCLVSTNTK